jgi:hypothetical protein
VVKEDQKRGKELRQEQEQGGRKQSAKQKKFPRLRKRK